MKIDFAIIRPYVTLPEEGGGLDRYLTLKDSLEKFGLKINLYTSDFIHNTKTKRLKVDNHLNNIYFIDAGSYQKNISIKRLLYELCFSYKIYSILKKSNINHVLIGEPIMGAWFFLLILKLRKKLKIYSDFIDLLPEAYQINLKNRFLINLLGLPMKITRWLSINYIYDKNFFVSRAYRDYLNCKNYKDGGVFYWGCQKKFFFEKNDRFMSSIIYAGSLGEGYDIETILELGKLRPDLKILIAGSGPKAGLCEIAHKNKYIYFLGKISTEELTNIYINSGIGILPYKKNSAVSLPIKLFDYINYKLRIVSSLKMECESIIKLNNIGINYEPGNVKSLSNAIDLTMKLNVNNSTYEDLAEKFSAEYQYKKFAKRIYEIISKD